jgi:hypothetical protein
MNYREFNLICQKNRRIRLQEELCVGVGPSEAVDGYNAFFEGKKAVIEGCMARAKRHYIPFS